MSDQTPKRGPGRPPHPLGRGIKCAVMIPQQLHDALLEDVVRDGSGPRNFSEAIVARLRRGKPRGRAL